MTYQKLYEKMAKRESSRQIARIVFAALNIAGGVAALRQLKVNKDSVEESLDLTGR